MGIIEGQLYVERQGWQNQCCSRCNISATHCTCAAEVHAGYVAQATQLKYKKQTIYIV